MASINKLSIRGVRAFSPEDAEQVVEFYFPCTIIVGSNGCGKTTIIESLKFAVCGALPPGNKSGQAFVHDPRSIGQSVVKANIKLRFTNRASSSMVVVRSMEVTQKKLTMSFKQLDGVLRTTDKHGNRQSLSHKCSELDKQIPLLLGVSKPILEHVVFCHQEDSSWPLQEGAVLKKRFDDIFDSTRYSKALEVFTKVKKEYQFKVKDLKADLSGLSSHKYAAKQYQNEIKKYTEQIEIVEEDIITTKQSIKTIDTNRNKLRFIIEQVEEYDTKIDTKQNMLSQEKAVRKKQRRMLQDDLTTQYTLKQIKDMLRDFDIEMEQQIIRKNEVEDDLNKFKFDIDQLRKEESIIQSKIVRLEAEKDNHLSKLKLRYEKMIDLGQRYGLGDLVSQISQQQQQQRGGEQTSSQQQQPASQDTQLTSYIATNNTTITSSIVGGGGGLDTTIDQQQQEPILDISQDDMDEYFKTLQKKEDELKMKLDTIRDKFQQQEDSIQSILADLLGKQKSIENDRIKINKQQNDARNELQQIANKFTKTSRLRKNDVEEAKRQAIKFAKQRDDTNNDPRRTEIPTEIRVLEEKIDKIKRTIEDDQITLRDLRHSADAQNSITILKEQCIKDLETLQEHIDERSFMLQQYNIRQPKELPGSSGWGEDDNGDELTQTIQNIVDTITNKYDDSNLELSKSTDEITQYQKIVSETTALLSHDQQMLIGKRNRMVQLDNNGNGCIAKVRNVVHGLQRFEQSMGKKFPSTTIDESTPQELFSYLGKRLEEEEEESMEGIQPQTVKRILSRLKKQVRANQNRPNTFTCPCCTRDMETEKEIQAFMDQMKLLMNEQNSPLIKLDERNQTARIKYQNYRKIVEENMNDILEYRRIFNEVNDIEQHSKELDTILTTKTLEFEKQKSNNDDIQKENDELRELLDLSKRWSDAASRISEKRMQVNQKQLDLSMSMADSGGRDLKTVERELTEKLENKDVYSNQINRLNKEMSSLNNRITQLSTLATRMDNLARDKEAKFAKDQELSERKVVLSETISKCAEEEKKLQENIAPLRQKIKMKEAEKQRMRSHAKEEEKRSSETYNSFVSDVRNLKEIVQHIEDYMESNKEKDLEKLSEKANTIISRMETKQEEIEKIQPDLDKLSKAVEDQERHKKNLKENIDLIQSGQHIEELENEIAKLEEEADNIEGHDTCNDDWEQLAEDKQNLLSSKARLEGRRGEILESIRSLKRKLSTPEYKNVDEEHRVAMIKHETTQMAVRDIEKYYSALDKALLRFHSIKIAEINTIIRDLWSLTYKGEDITNIELVSGQDSGSRASRSYNYRVVMTKGNSQMDMRGRCSAGQRVLASIVIRLALAETFCINCGCIALDEPTVNLDYHNKKGLAIALAQIIASRAQQSNFQLIMITHDEDFVAMMKTELSSQTGFDMPEKYFQVRREEGTDGKFYSKIDAVDWDELV